jgi:hypothetical protein
MKNIRNEISNKPATLYIDLDNKTQEIRIKLDTHIGYIFGLNWVGFTIIERLNLDIIYINYGKYNI